ncbi:MAG TPA: PqqD family protein [bacterium]
MTRRAPAPSTPLTLETAVAIRPSARFHDLDGEFVLLSLDTACYYGLDGPGADIWRGLAAGRTLREIHAALCERYEAGASRLESDLLALIGELVRERLLDVR